MRDNPLTDKIQRTVKLGPLSHTRNLLHEDLLAPFTLQFFDLASYDGLPIIAAFLPVFSVPCVVPAATALE